MTRQEMTAEEFDEYFDNGGDMTEFIERGSIRFPNRKSGDKRINISMPEWMVDEVDAIAKYYGNTRQGMINIWVGERLRREKAEIAEMG